MAPLLLLVQLTAMALALNNSNRLKAVFVDEDTFAKASLSSEQARTIKAEAAQKAAELRAQEVTKELENTTKVFELHMEELRAKQQEISKRDEEIKLLEAIIQTLGGKESCSTIG
ncbi:hypothetical protein JRO89_XS04G0022100 [Xanthoceras sorbifolium]|uniref:Uncharacterized protein n=1 Tax=Xanthoceras sorbifolium TaxID=99658 RepID=A0ABQ8I3Y2_9ROSI|nr:hypothetical protein JRO89_XS04G0022100 [Xanthoceras sorbifolium]